jgi:hypothetical protein
MRASGEAGDTVHAGDVNHFRHCCRRAFQPHHARGLVHTLVLETEVHALLFDELLPMLRHLQFCLFGPRSYRPALRFSR